MSKGNDVCIAVAQAEEKDSPISAPTLDGACTNQAESFLAHLRRMVDGLHHDVSPQYLYQYANHAAWLEDHRRLDNGSLAFRALGLALKHPVSRDWKGYWQRQATSKPTIGPDIEPDI